MAWRGKWGLWGWGWQLPPLRHISWLFLQFPAGSRSLRIAINFNTFVCRRVQLRHPFRSQSIVVSGHFLILSIILSMYNWFQSFTNEIMSLVTMFTTIHIWIGIECYLCPFELPRTYMTGYLHVTALCEGHHLLNKELSRVEFE